MPKVQADGLPLPLRYGAILTIVIGISMAVLDGAIANVALPTIATDLHATPASSIWVVNAYQIAIVISLLSFSFLGDMFGYRRIYKCGLVVFLLSSLFCALSDSLQMLTLARVIQGFGGAALMSVNTALIRLIYPQRFLGRGMGINSFIVAVSSRADNCCSNPLHRILEMVIFNQRTVGNYRPASGNAFSATQWFSRQ